MRVGVDVRVREDRGGEVHRRRSETKGETVLA